MSVKFIPKQENMMKLLDKIETKITNSMVDTAKKIAPSKSGKLRDSIKVRKKMINEWDIIADTDYSLFIEMGTRDITANPFLRPAVYNWQQNYR